MSAAPNAHPTPPPSGASWAQAYLDASLIVAQNPDPVDLLRALLRFIGPGISAARLGRIAAETPNRALIVADAEGSAVRPANYPERISDYPRWDTLANHELVIIHDAATDPGLTADQRGRLRARHINGLILAPLFTQGELLGLLILTSADPLAVEPARIRALGALLDQAASGLAAGQMVSELSAERERTLRYTRQLDAVTRLALRAGSFDSSQALYEYAVKELVLLLRADHGGVLLLDSDAKAGVVVAEYPDSGALGRRLTMAGNELFDMVIEQRGAPVIANHVASNHQLLPDTRAVFQSIGLRSIMFIPVMQGGRIIASIGMDMFTEEREFDEGMADTAQAMAAQISGTLENIRRAEQLTRQLRAVETLSELATSIYRLQEDERTLFDSVGQDLAQTTGSTHIGFAMFDEGEAARIVSEYPARTLPAGAVSLGSTPLAAAVQRIRAGASDPVVLNKLNPPPATPDDVWTPFMRYNLQSVLVVPLTIADQLAGVVSFGRNAEQAEFEPETVAVARTIGAELSIGLQNIRLVQDARRRAEQLWQISEFTRAVQTSEAVESVLDQALATLRSLAPADRIGVFFLADDERELQLVARYQDGATTLPLRRGPNVPIAGTYVGQVWSSRTPLLLTNALEDTHNRARGDVGIRSMLLYPFEAGPGFRGVVSLGAVRAHTYSESDAAIVQQMVNQLAAALESRATLAARQAAAEQEALINTLSARYQRAVDVNDMLSTTLRELSGHLGAKRSRIRLALEPAPVVEHGGQSKQSIDVW